MVRTMTCAALLLAPLGCTGPRAVDRPAVLAAPDEAGIAELERAAAMVAGVASVTLSGDAFTQASALVLERRVPSAANGAAAVGRTVEEPVTLTLVLRGRRCLLVHAAQRREWQLRASRCVALSATQLE
jgi:hypothetical protein